MSIFCSPDVLDCLVLQLGQNIRVNYKLLMLVIELSPRPTYIPVIRFVVRTLASSVA